MLVWSIPLMTVLLTGTVAWIGSYDLDPPKPIASSTKAIKVQAVSLTGNGCSSIRSWASRASITSAIPVGMPVSFELTSSAS